MPHVDALLPPLLRELRDAEPINRQNAAFALGVLAAGVGGAALGAQLPKLLQARPRPRTRTRRQAPAPTQPPSRLPT